MQAGLSDKLRLAAEYLRFRMQARSRFTIHSPFLFELVNEVFRDKRHYYAFDEIEAIRQNLLADDSVVTDNYYGAGSKAGVVSAPNPFPQGGFFNGKGTRVGDIVRTASLPASCGRLLFRLVNHFRPCSILELGTSAGISTLYLASAAPSVPVISLEGSAALSGIARQQVSKMKLQNVTIMTGAFDAMLPQALQRLGNAGLIFIDGDHRRTPLLGYLRQCLQHVTAKSIIAIDDIYWSDDMKEAWEEISALPQVSMSVDLFRMGLLFFRKGVAKQHHKVVY